MMLRFSESRSNPLATNLFMVARHYLGSRGVLPALAAIAVVAGLAFNWSWLVAAGIAPLLLAVLPCVAMCALGLCMNKMAGRPDPPHGPAVVEKEPLADTGTEGLKHARDPSA